MRGRTAKSEEKLIEKILSLADEGFTAVLIIASDSAPQQLHAIQQRDLRVPTVEQFKKEIAGKKIVPEIQIPCKLNIRNSAAPPP